jgi:hypothetical protein
VVSFSKVKMMNEELDLCPLKTKTLMLSRNISYQLPTSTAPHPRWTKNSAASLPKNVWLFVHSFISHTLLNTPETWSLESVLLYKFSKNTLMNIRLQATGWTFLFLCTELY